jgi:dTDP-4-dehydrorhamnose reductase
MSWLILGGDSQLGSALYNRLILDSEVVAKTSRRKIPPSSGAMHLDLSCINQKQFAKSDIAILCIGVSSIIYCEQNPEESFFINVTQTFNLARLLIESGSHVVFLSSSTVFNGITPFPKETSEKTPTCEYGRQKAILEDRLLQAFPKHVSIIRITKVIGPTNWLLNGLLTLKNTSLKMSLYSDYKFSPISLDYAIDMIIKVAMQKQNNIFHLSLDEDISYYEFGVKACNHLNQKLVNLIPQSSLQNSDLIYRPKYNALDMNLTSLRTNGAVTAQTLSKLMYQLF